MTRSYDQETAAAVDVIKVIADDSSAIISSMLRAATSNPLLGILAGAVIVDVLYTKKVLSTTGYVFCMVTLGLADAAVAVQNIDAISAGNYNFLGIADVNRPAPTYSDIAPTATTVVYAEASPTPAKDTGSALNSLLALAGGAKSLPKVPSGAAGEVAVVA